ncbi:EamA family transporter [Streptomyces sp. V4I23]|uniref:EamA family transporter n=1 Tax=Streptomyces sp. V4I23 TaxID=3042282 RepID=UPI0027D76C33|nr:EamA family transporter [Streptomyces sp. V4I23]
MTFRHMALATAVAATWGVTFVFISVGLDNFPPLLFCSARFAAAALPGVFFVGAPRVAWRWVFAVGIVLGVVTFGLLFVGMHLGMPAGLSSLVVQSQGVFTIAIAAVLLHERPGRLVVAGMAVALLGIGLAAADQGGGGPIGAFALVVFAAVAWGLSNVLTRKASPPDLLRWTVWISAIPPVPLLALSLLIEGPEADLAALRSLNLAGLSAIAFVGWVATLFAFGAWGHLLRTYDTTAVAPYSLLVPVFGMSSAWLLLGEEMSLMATCAAALVITGVGLTALKPRRPSNTAPAK